MAYTGYTNIETFQRDFLPTSSDEVFGRLVERAAVIAYNYINSKLGSVYPVPFVAPFPGTIVDISDLFTKCVVSKLQGKRGPILPKPGKVQRDAIHDDCSIAFYMLDELVSLKTTIPGVLPLAGAAGYHTRAGYTPTFDVDAAENHQPDPDLLDRIRSERDA
jgi:hypothetical protein